MVYFSPAFSFMFKQKYMYFNLPAYPHTVHNVYTLDFQFLLDSPKHLKQSLSLQSVHFVFHYPITELIMLHQQSLQVLNKPW